MYVSGVCVCDLSDVDVVVWKRRKDLKPPPLLNADVVANVVADPNLRVRKFEDDDETSRRKHEAGAKHDISKTTMIKGHSIYQVNKITTTRKVM